MSGTIDFNAAKARFEHARARMLRAGFSDREARSLAVRQLYPLDPWDGAAAEFVERIGPATVHPLDVIRHEVWWHAATLIPRWLPVLVAERNAGAWEARRRKDWGDRWTVEIDYLSGQGYGVWRETTTGARGSDLVALFAWLTDEKYGVAARDLAAALGITPPARRKCRAA